MRGVSTCSSNQSGLFRFISSKLFIFKTAIFLLCCCSLLWIVVIYSLIWFDLPFAWFPSRSSSATTDWACRNSSPVDSSVSPTDVPPLYHTDKQHKGSQQKINREQDVKTQTDAVDLISLRQLKCWTNLLIHISLITVIRVRPAWADLTRDVFIRSCHTPSGGGSRCYSTCLPDHPPPGLAVTAPHCSPLHCLHPSLSSFVQLYQVF